MIIESKGAKTFFACLGVTLLCLGFGGLFNLDDVYINICWVKDSRVHQWANTILTAITLLLMGISGGFMLWWVAYSIKKCREMEGETKPYTFSLKKLCKSIAAFILIIAFLIAFVALIDYNNQGAISRFAGTGNLPRMKQSPPSDAPVSCEAKVIKFHKKDAFAQSNDWNGMIGESTLLIESPQTYKGRVVKIRISQDDTTRNLFETIGARLSFVIPSARLINSANHVTTNDFIGDVTLNPDKK